MRARKVNHSVFTPFGPLLLLVENLAQRLVHRSHWLRPLPQRRGELFQLVVHHDARFALLVACRFDGRPQVLDGHVLAYNFSHVETAPDARRGHLGAQGWRETFTRVGVAQVRAVEVRLGDEDVAGRWA